MIASAASGAASTLWPPVAVAVLLLAHEGVLVFDLEDCVVAAETSSSGLSGVQHGGDAGAFAHDEVRRDVHLGRRHGPDVQVVHVDDSGQRLQRALHALRIDARRGRTHEHERAVLDGAVRGGEHEAGEDERAHGVDSVPVRQTVGVEPALVEEVDERGGDHHADRLNQIADDMRHRRAHRDAPASIAPDVLGVCAVGRAQRPPCTPSLGVGAERLAMLVLVAVRMLARRIDWGERLPVLVRVPVLGAGRRVVLVVLGWRGAKEAVAVRVAVAVAVPAVAVPAQHLHDHQVEHHTRHRGDAHHQPVHRLGRDEPRDRLVHEDARHEPHGKDRAHSAQHLCAVVAVRELCRLRPRGDVQRDDRDKEARDVREHVRRVSEHGERVRQHATHDLDHHEEQREAHGQVELVQRGAVRR
mmetsp:Transcript_5294/g.13557  ORF Transcript_5294/g.13557 Transcript_5294/m.13557 type:complete len:414 (+) Transcript_5294:237-1478(+)